ncbi:MAG: archaellin/type IV pilin N-terminal domain-containing protein, partial [Nitrosopumilaceae archaeon]
MSHILNTQRRRAVAPIIATLLMVAIAVVGGILIFVFAQGFFTDTSIQGPTIDSLEIFGYDAR